MRSPPVLEVVAPLMLGLSACGDDDRTVVVSPPPSRTYVVPSSMPSSVCPAGTVCTKTCQGGTLC